MLEEDPDCIFCQFCFAFFPFVNDAPDLVKVIPISHSYYESVNFCSKNEMGRHTCIMYVGNDSRYLTMVLCTYHFITPSLLSDIVVVF